MNIILMYLAAKILSWLPLSVAVALVIAIIDYFLIGFTDPLIVLAMWITVPAVLYYEFFQIGAWVKENHEGHIAACSIAVVLVGVFWYIYFPYDQVSNKSWRVHVKPYVTEMTAYGALGDSGESALEKFKPYVESAIGFPDDPVRSMPWYNDILFPSVGLYSSVDNWFIRERANIFPTKDAHWVVGAVRVVSLGSLILFDWYSIPITFLMFWVWSSLICFVMYIFPGVYILIGLHAD